MEEGSLTGTAWLFGGQINFEGFGCSRATQVVS